MDLETKNKVGKNHQHTKKQFELDIAELYENVCSIRTDVTKLPHKIYIRYSKTINDLLDRVTHLEHRIQILETTR